MEKLSFEQIMEVLKEKIEEVSEFAFDDFNEEELGLGKVEEVEQVGGEDQGSTWYSVKHFVEHDVYIRVEGYYSSYEGTDFYDGWDSCRNVRPAEKTITVYE
jgi:hypothetical protein